MLTNPSMTDVKAKAYIDTIVGFVTPRIVVQFDLAQLYTSIKEVDMNKYLSVYPNPASSIVNVQFTGTGNITSLRVIDIAGRTLVNTQSINNNKYVVDATQLAKGVYFIDASLSNGSTARQRFVVQ
jgi:serine protease AprX